MLNRDITTKLYIWLTGLPEPFDIKATTMEGMDAHGWILITTIDVLVGLSEMNVDLKQIKEDALNNQLNKTKEKYNEEITLIEDSIRTLKESK